VVEHVVAGVVGGVSTVLTVAASAQHNLSTFASSQVVALNTSNTAASIFLLPLDAITWRGGMVGWLGASNHGSACLVTVGSSNTTTLHANGLYGVYDLILRLLDVRFGHLFRNLGGVSKF